MNRARGVDLCEVGCGNIRDYITANHVFYIIMHLQYEYSIIIIILVIRSVLDASHSYAQCIYARDILSPHAYATKCNQS